jgi:hypothetical protein
MQCSDCGYISFKKEKACRSCGFKFKKSTQSSQSIAGKKSFSIFAGSEKRQSENSPLVENVGLLDEQELDTFIDPKTGDFNLDLPDTSEETTIKSPVSSENTEYQSMEFNIYEDIELEEIEGLGLEPLHATETFRQPETNTTVDSIEEIKIDEPEETASLDPVLEIGEPEETASLDPVLEIGEPEETASLDPVLEIGEPRSQEVALDLDDNEIILELEDNQSIPAAPPVAAAPLDEIVLNLEIDDSDGPLTTQNQNIPDIEIKDLGLELEKSDEPELDKP